MKLITDIFRPKQKRTRVRTSPPEPVGTLKLGVLAGLRVVRRFRLERRNTPFGLELLECEYERDGSTVRVIVSETRVKLVHGNERAFYWYAEIEQGTRITTDEACLKPLAWHSVQTGRPVPREYWNDAAHPVDLAELKAAGCHSGMIPLTKEQIDTERERARKLRDRNERGRMREQVRIFEAASARQRVQDRLFAEELRIPDSLDAPHARRTPL